MKDKKGTKEEKKIETENIVVKLDQGKNEIISRGILKTKHHVFLFSLVPREYSAFVN